MEIEKEVAPEVLAQEHSNYVNHVIKQRCYPVYLNIKNDINEGYTRLHQNFDVIDSTDAIEVTIKINNSHYLVSEVRDSINEIFQSILEYFH